MRKHVESEAQRASLLELGCREAQGFLFSRPIEPDAFVRMLVPDVSVALA